MEQLQLPYQKIEMKNTCIHLMFSYQNKDVNRMMRFCDPDREVYFAPLPEAGRGRIGELGKNPWNQNIESFPDITNTIDAIVAKGKYIRFQAIISGTQAQDFAGIVNRGERFNNNYIFNFSVEE